MGILIPRGEWGSTYDYDERHRYKPANPAKVETVLHTTVTIAPDLTEPWADEYAAMRTLERIGTERFGSGVSYNAVVMPSGRAYRGQPLDNKSTHSEYGDWNYTRASIALCGNHEQNRPTEAMLRTVAEIQAAWLTASTVRTVTLRGHYEVAAKACPGKYAIARMDDIAMWARAIATGDDPVTDQDKHDIANLCAALVFGEDNAAKFRNRVREALDQEQGDESGLGAFSDRIADKVAARIPAAQIDTEAVASSLLGRLQAWFTRP